MEYNEGHIIEGLDRLHVITEMIDSILIDHPAIVKAECVDKISQAQKLLYDSYQGVAGLKEL